MRYEDADVLINLGNIKDVELLKSAQADVTGYTLAILHNTEFKKFDSQALLDAHRIIF